MPELFTRMSGTPSASRTASSPVSTLRASVTSIRIGMGGAAGVANLAREGFEPLDAPRRERHRRPVRGEGAGEVPAEAARRPGHERGAAVQVERQSLCPWRVSSCFATRPAPCIVGRRIRLATPGDTSNSESRDTATTRGGKWFGAGEPRARNDLPEHHSDGGPAASAYDSVPAHPAETIHDLERNMSPDETSSSSSTRARPSANVDARVAAYADASAATRARLASTCWTCATDSGEKETLDIFPTGRSERTGPPVHPRRVLARDVTRATTASSPTYSTRPGRPRCSSTTTSARTVTLDTIVAQTMRAIAWTFRNIAQYGGDPNRLYVSGNSAGGHPHRDGPRPRLGRPKACPADIIKGAIPVTGVFDCEPVPDITVNELVRIDREAARRLSPLRNPPRHALPVLVAVGGAEPPLWVAMSKDYAALCREHGLDCEYMELPGHDHFDVSRAVGDAASPLAQAMLRMMGL